MGAMDKSLASLAALNARGVRVFNAGGPDACARVG
jgi:hypothetical protein